MKRLAVIAIVFAVLTGAEVIDRVAAAVGYSVITESEILRQLRMTALLNGEEPDLSGASKRQAAERLVEQMLIRREIDTTRYALTANGDQIYQSLRQRSGSEGAWQQLLRKHQLHDREVRETLDWQATLLEFVQVRFRPGVQVPAEEVREYYEAEVKGKPGAPTFEAAQEDIEEVLTQQRVDRALERWLGQARTQQRIVFRQEVFR